MERSGGEEHVIGIYLGTTSSCVAVWRYDRVEIIVNEHGNRTTPSFVAFTDDERLVGEDAENQAAINPRNTIFDGKRLIGRRWSDHGIQSGMKTWPFKVIADAIDRPLIVVHEGTKKEKVVTPEEIIATVLSKMKANAENFLGCLIKMAVVTVPAYFNDSQRASILVAGRISGLEIVRMINEPTAAAMAYGLHLKKSGEKHLKRVLVFHLGGGTLDVSILEIKDGDIQVKATGRDTHLGGEDFNIRMVRHFAREYKTKHSKDITGAARVLKRLRDRCEMAKKKLSFVAEDTITIDCFHEGVDFESKITRKSFEILNMDLFDRCMEIVEQCLDDAKMERCSVNDVVLVGGSTRMIKIQEMLSEFFYGCALHKRINAEEVVAFGAALHARNLGSSSDANPRNDIVLHDITPLSLGTPNHQGAMNVFIPRNTPVPVVREQTWTLTGDNLTSTTFPVYEGEREMARDNKLLGKLHLTGISPQPAYEANIKVTFRVDVNGILDVSAVDLATGNRDETRISNDHGRLSTSEIHRKIAEAQQHKLEDKRRRRKADAKSKLEKCVCLTRNTIRQSAIASSLSSKEKNRLEHALQSAVEWSEEDDPTASEDDYYEKKREIEKLCNSIKSLHF